MRREMFYRVPDFLSGLRRPISMNEQRHGEHLGQPLFLDETPDLHRRTKPEPNAIDDLFADEDALPPGSRSGSLRRRGLSFADSWTAISDRFSSPAVGRFRGVLFVALVIAAVLFGFLAARALLN